MDNFMDILTFHASFMDKKTGSGIQGQVYHLIGSIVPTEGESPKFAQIYFIDNQDSEVATKCAIVDYFIGNQDSEVATIVCSRSPHGSFSLNNFRYK